MGRIVVRGLAAAYVAAASTRARNTECGGRRSGDPGLAADTGAVLPGSCVRRRLPWLARTTVSRPPGRPTPKQPRQRPAEGEARAETSFDPDTTMQLKAGVPLPTDTTMQLKVGPALPPDATMQLKAAGPAFS